MIYSKHRNPCAQERFHKEDLLLYRIMNDVTISMTVTEGTIEQGEIFVTIMIYEIGGLKK